MKNLILSLLVIITMNATAQFSEYPAWTGELGLHYTKNRSTFRIWSPPAAEAQLLLYKEALNGAPFKTIAMHKGAHGTWQAELEGDWKGVYYVFKVQVNGKWYNEVPDPYAKAVGVNGKRAAVIDLRDTDPAGWATDRSPDFSKHNRAVDALIYELHVRDASIDASSGIQHKGTFAGLAEWGTQSSDGLSTGLSHIKELGVTHVHLLPFYDYSSVDETLPAHQYNWGYDPLNYNVPEGSYSSAPQDPLKRIKELKQMVQAFHRKGLRVIFDAVYNHTALTERSNFNQLVPGYYYRHKKNAQPDEYGGAFSNATACGNETASEMPMMRKFMLESVLYWVKEFHIDGFRFDLMGVHDIETMNLLSRELHKIKPDIILYGEGWTAGDSPLPDSLRALKKNAWKLDRIAVFSDDIRDGLKGSVFDAKDRGFASGKPGMEESVKFGITAACEHPQIQYDKVNYSKHPYATDPASVISYCECHDNNTLWDKIEISAPGASREDREKMQGLALTVVLTSQGIPFLHAGTEFLRSKFGVENSYNAGDSINAIRWHLKKENNEMVKYMEQLIRLRKGHPAFRLSDAKRIAADLHFESAPAGTIAYTLDGTHSGDTWKKIFVALNGSGHDNTITLPPGKWSKALGGGSIEDGQLTLGKYSSVILYID